MIHTKKIAVQIDLLRNLLVNASSLLPSIIKSGTSVEFEF